MKLIGVRVYPGRNIYSHWPVVRADVDIGRYVDIPTCDIGKFNEKLISILPGLKEHKCSRGYVNGFYERLKEGTYLAHVMEHIALEIQKLLGYDLKFGKTRYLRDQTIYYLVFSYIDQTAGYQSARLAFNIIKSILENRRINLDKELLDIREKIRARALGPSTAVIIEEAHKRNIPTIRIGENNSIIQLGYGKHQRRIQATITDSTSCMAVDMACDKEETNRILKKYGLPVPEGVIVTTVEEAFRQANSLGLPVVIKPYNGNQGKGVSLNLFSQEDIRRAFEIANKYSDKILVEKYIEGRHYRVVVVAGQVVGVSERIAAHVIGNGINTIEELIHMENRNPLRGEGHEKPLTRIKIDDLVHLTLSKLRLDIRAIPKKGQIIYLRENDNLSTGGIALDATGQIHPYNKRLAERAAQIVGLDIAGIDITTRDIARPIKEDGGAIIEVNACPGIRMHHYPSAGQAQNVAGAIVDHLFPEGKAHSVPIISITGTNGKTTTTRMVASILRANNMVVGMANTGGIYIDDDLIMEGDTTGPKSAELVLMDKNIDIALLETARGGIVNKGLGYDLADVALVTNIDDDHIGVDGINTLEDMADVKSLVVEAVKEEGYCVINADDDYGKNISARARGEIVYFSKSYKNPLIIRHKKAGGKVVYLKGKKIYIFNGREESLVMEVDEIPATFKGLLEHNVENSLGAIAIGYCIGIDIAIIKKALGQFDTDIENNPGRFNIFNVGDFKVIIDYAHNIGSYGKILKSLEAMEKNRLIGVIGVPGDRTDINILKIGELSGKYFDYLYIKEDRDLRGRRPKEVARLLKEGCILGKIPEKHIKIEVDERLALIKAMEFASSGDIIVVFYEDYKHLVEAIEDFKKSNCFIKTPEKTVGQVSALADKA